MPAIDDRKIYKWPFDPSHNEVVLPALHLPTYQSTYLSGLTVFIIKMDHLSVVSNQPASQLGVSTPFTWASFNLSSNVGAAEAKVMAARHRVVTVNNRQGWIENKLFHEGGRFIPLGESGKMYLPLSLRAGYV